MKLFFASQFLIASLLMIWNATKKGLWDSFTFKKPPSKTIVKIANHTLGSEPSIPHEKNTIFLANNELPHFEDSLVPLLSPRIESPKNNINLNQEQYPEDTNIDTHLVSSFTTNVINKDWELLQPSPETVKGFGQKMVERNEFFPTKPVLQPRDKIPLIAAGLSLIPGLGHAYRRPPNSRGIDD